MIMILYMLLKFGVDITTKSYKSFCSGILDRHLLKIKFQQNHLRQLCSLRKKLTQWSKYNLNDEEVSYFVFTGEAVNTTYIPHDESINILFKDGQVKDISQVDNALIHKTLSTPVKKFYICFLP